MLKVVRLLDRPAADPAALCEALTEISAQAARAGTLDDLKKELAPYLETIAPGPQLAAYLATIPREATKPLRWHKR